MKYAGLIVVLIVVVQVIAGLVQQATKKQQQERARELAEQRRRQSGGGEGGRGGGSPTRPVGRVQVQTGTAEPSRLETLAARRKAQLEELRRRRTAQVRAGASQVKTGRAAVPAAAPAAKSTAMPRVKTIATLKADHGAIRAREAAEARRRQETGQRARQAEEESARRKQLERQRRAADRAKRKRKQEAAVQAAARAKVEAVDVYGVSEERGGRADRLRQVLSNRRTLRELFIIKELLDAPISLRSASDRA